MTALVSAALASGAEAPPAPAAEAGPSALTQRYRIDIGSDGIELTPIDRDSAVESIELLDGEDEALVNGKPFSAGELTAFLGEDGRLLAEILSLSDSERRRRLGHVEGGEGQPPGVDGRGVEAEADVVIAVPRPPKPPRPPKLDSYRDDDRVSFGESIEIAAGESAGEAVCIGCSVRVEGHVDGDVVAVGGRVEIASGATVDGNVVSVGGRVLVESGAVVDGDAVSVGGSVQVEEGGVVEGQRSSVGWGAGWFGRSGGGFSPFDFNGSFSDLFWSVLRLLLLGLMGAIFVVFAREPVGRAARRLLDEPWKALFAGLLTQLLFLPVLVLVTVILAVSVIGIPLLVLVPVAILAFVVAMLIGYVAVAQSLGRWAAARFDWDHLREPFMPVFIGLAMLQGITIVARLLSLPGGVLGLIAFALLGLGFFIKYVGWTVGLGGMVLSVLARDWRRAPRSSAPPLAPIDFSRDDEAPRAEAPSAAAAGAEVEERTESVDEGELRERDERH